MVSNNGAVEQQSGEEILLQEVAALPEPELSPAGRAVFERRFLASDPDCASETARDRLWSVAATAARGSAPYEGQEAQARRRRDYYLAMARLEFLPAAATLANAGRDPGRPLLASYVLPLSISADALIETNCRAARVRQFGGAVGLALPNAGPGAGPTTDSMLELCDAVARLTRSDAGAVQVLLPVDHPDIPAFLDAEGRLADRHRLAYETAAPYLGPEQRAALKRALSGAQRDAVRLVIGLTDRFMLAVVRGDNYDLRDPASREIIGQYSARDVFERIVGGAWERGEPGVVFLDRLNAGPANPVRDLGPLRATTPQGEALYSDEACAVGYLNLGRFYLPRPPRNGHSPALPVPNGSSNGHAGFTRHPGVDWERLGKAARLGVRFLDDLVSAGPYPDPRIEEMVNTTRRLGLGVMGWADLLVMLEVPYDSPQAVELADEIMRFVQETAADESRNLAEARGPFPAWERSVYKDGQPRRNATVTSVPATGPVSLMAGCSSGIEPLSSLARGSGGMRAGAEQPEIHPHFAEVAQREGFWSNELLQSVSRAGSTRGITAVPEYWQRVFATAGDLTAEWHIRMQAAFQRHAENAVAKTIRLPREATIEDIQQVFRLAYELGCHGVSVHRDGFEPAAGLRTGTEPAAQPIVVEHLQARPSMLQGLTYQEETPLGTAYVTVNVDEGGQPFEVFVNQGKTGSDVAALSVAIGKLTSLALRMPSPMSPAQRLQEVARRLRGIGGGTTWGVGPDRARSLPDALARVLERYIQHHAPSLVSSTTASAEGPISGAQLALPLVLTGEFCPECSNALLFEEGASKCRQCGLVLA